MWFYFDVRTVGRRRWARSWRTHTPGRPVRIAFTFPSAVDPLSPCHGYDVARRGPRTRMDRAGAAAATARFYWQMLLLLFSLARARRRRLYYGIHEYFYDHARHTVCMLTRGPPSFRVSPRGVQSSRARFTTNTMVVQLFRTWCYFFR